MVLLDTNVVSELRKVHIGKADPRVVAWANSVDARDLFISVISLAEIETGVMQIERRDAAQGAILRHWLERQVVPAFHERILPVDLEIARRSAALHVPDPRATNDALIAATALVRGMTVATRNVGDFRPMGVPVIDPWESA